MKLARASGQVGTTASPDSSLTKPLRADAQRNRARVLAAAEAVFAARGVAASTEEVAREAGVGIATVFRHFPTKEALLEAVIVSRLQRFADEAQALVAATTADPGHSFYTLVWRAVDQSAAKNAVAAAPADAGVDLTPATAPLMAEVRNSLDILLTRAQRVGAVRDDVGVNEVIALLIGAARAAESTGGDQAVLQRTVAIICDGLRPPGSR